MMGKGVGGGGRDDGNPFPFSYCALAHLTDFDWLCFLVFVSGARAHSKHLLRIIVKKKKKIQRGGKVAKGFLA